MTTNNHPMSDKGLEEAAREVRIATDVPKGYSGGKWHYDSRPLVRLGDVGKWSVVRRADFPQAMPFVMSRKQWDKLPRQPSSEGGDG